MTERERMLERALKLAELRMQKPQPIAAAHDDCELLPDGTIVLPCGTRLTPHPDTGAAAAPETATTASIAMTINCRTRQLVNYAPVARTPPRNPPPHQGPGHLQAIRCVTRV